MKRKREEENTDVRERETKRIKFISEKEQKKQKEEEDWKEAEELQMQEDIAEANRRDADDIDSKRQRQKQIEENEDALKVFLRKEEEEELTETFIRTEKEEKLTADFLRKQKDKERKDDKMGAMKRRIDDILMNGRNIPLDIVRIRGDGNCGFRAIAHQTEGDQEKWREVKERAMTHLLDNQHLYKNIQSDSEFQMYIQKMILDGEFMDHTMIQVIADVDCIDIIVDGDLLEDPMLFTPRGQNAQKTVLLNYIPAMYKGKVQDSGHYESFARRA